MELTESQEKLFDIANEIKEILSFCSEDYPTEPEVLNRRITKLNMVLARTTELFKKSKSLYNVKLGEESEMLEIKYPKIAPTKAKNMLAKSIDQEESVLRYCEKAIRTVEYQIRSVITQLSYEKEVLNKMTRPKWVDNLAVEFNALRKQINRVEADVKNLK